MDIKLGNRIYALRKAKNMTQEALAKELGVSAPAISKWETDSSFPDVTLLCPLARALETDLNTLFSFEEALSETEIRDIGAKLREMVYAGNGYQAEEELICLLKAYPSDVVLKISAISVYSILLSVVYDAPEGDKTRWNERKKELAEWVYNSENPTYHAIAISMLISITLEENNFDRAEALLQEAEKSHVDFVDFTMLRVSLHLAKGEKEQAVEKMFHIENPSYRCIYAESYIRAGEYERALEHLEMYVGSATRELKSIILRALSLEKLFEPIRSEPRFMKIIELLQHVCEMH